MSSERESLPLSRRGAQFTTTHWSVVLAAGRDSSSGALSALEQLCRTYWYPLYAYARRRGQSPDDAADLVQGFFAEVIAKRVFRDLDRESGRFRSFLLTCFNRYLKDEHDHAVRLKRGGGHVVLSLDMDTAEQRYHLEPAELLDPEKIFERRWALVMLERVLQVLKTELEAEDKGQLLVHLQELVVGESGAARHAEIGARLGMSENAVAVTVHRLRQRYRRILRQKIAETVSRPEEVEEEMRHLRQILRG